MKDIIQPNYRLNRPIKAYIICNACKIQSLCKYSYRFPAANSNRKFSYQFLVLSRKRYLNLSQFSFLI